jgi:hypothetical protein
MRNTHEFRTSAIIASRSGGVDMDGRRARSQYVVERVIHTLNKRQNEVVRDGGSRVGSSVAWLGRPFVCGVWRSANTTPAAIDMPVPCLIRHEPGSTLVPSQNILYSTAS